ncbi:MAG TPA: DUF5666 domain-containing protein [Mycobacterium sp.]|nr:DUF5666 domain-containing protein [Mycobacterium sp.]
MSATCFTPRLTRLAILAVAGVTALSVAACGTSNKEKAAPSASPTSSSAAPAKGKEQVAGLIASVSGSTIQVTQRTGSATVDFTPSTHVSEVTPAQLTDVTAGSCVTVQPTRESARAGGAITAQSVRVSPAIDGKCPQPKQPAAGSATTAPSAPSSTAPAKNPAVHGTVASVAGNTITVTSVHGSGNPSQTTVTVTDTTKYSKQTTTDAQAITQGKCLTAQGTKDSGGTLQATAITVRPATNGTCPQPGELHHGHAG